MIKVSLNPRMEASICVDASGDRPFFTIKNADSSTYMEQEFPSFECLRSCIWRLWMEEEIDSSNALAMFKMTTKASLLVDRTASVH